MSKLTAAFNKSRRNRSAKPSGNVILKVKEFTDTTVKGEVMTGRGAGTEIEIRVPNNGGKSVGVKEMTKMTHKSYVDVEAGGTLRVEKLREGSDGVYDARWMRTFNGQPTPDHDVIYDAVAQLRTTRSDDPETPDKFYMHLVFPNEAKEAATIDELRAHLTEAFEAKNGAYMFLKEEGDIGFTYCPRTGQKVDGVWVYDDAADVADGVINTLLEDQELLASTFAEHPFSVVPASRVTVGSATAETISDAIEEAREKGQEPRVSTIDPQNFRVIPTGVRVQYALNDRNEENALPKDAADRLKERFLATAGEEAKEAIHKGGWRTVSNDDMRRFFEASGVSVTDYPESGWSQQSILLKNGIAIKAFGQEAAVPYPNLPVCKGAIATFRTEIREAIRTVVDGPVKSAEAEAPKAAEAPKTDVPEKATEAVSSEADIDDLDALLDGVQDADMGA